MVAKPAKNSAPAADNGVRDRLIGRNRVLRAFLRRARSILSRGRGNLTGYLLDDCLPYAARSTAYLPSTRSARKHVRRSSVSSLASHFSPRASSRMRMSCFLVRLSMISKSVSLRFMTISPRTRLVAITHVDREGMVDGATLWHVPKRRGVLGVAQGTW